MAMDIDPTNDYAFRLSFSCPENKLALIGLLNSILQLPSPIEDIQFENPFNLREFKDGKETILDVHAIDQNKNIFIVEMQFSNSASLEKRLVYYASDTYARQMSKGVRYDSLKPVYVVCITNRPPNPSQTEGHYFYQLRDESSRRVLTGAIEIHIVILGNYTVEEKDLPYVSNLERWIFWFKRARYYEFAEITRLLPDPSIVQATKALQKIQEKREDHLMYDLEEKNRRDKIWLIEGAMNQGLAQGREEGREEGRAEAAREGEIKLIELLQLAVGEDRYTKEELGKLKLESLSEISKQLEAKLKSRGQG